MIKTLLCDDHALVRESLGLALESEGDFRVLASVGTVAGAAQAASREQFDAALIDLHLAGESGLALVEHLRGTLPDCRSIILTGFPSDDLVFEAGRLGTFDVIDKSCSTKEVAARVRSAVSGRRVLDDFARRAAKERLAEKGLLAYRDLGATDREILSLIAQGMTDKQISQCVYLSAQTVRNRISRLLGLLGHDNRTQLALMVTALDPFVLGSPVGLK
jgi:two-component system, NarL family, response regulator DevR